MSEPGFLAVLSRLIGGGGLVNYFSRVEWFWDEHPVTGFVASAESGLYFVNRKLTILQAPCTILYSNIESIAIVEKTSDQLWAVRKKPGGSWSWATDVVYLWVYDGYELTQKVEKCYVADKMRQATDLWDLTPGSCQLDMWLGGNDWVFPIHRTRSVPAEAQKLFRHKLANLVEVLPWKGWFKVQQNAFEYYVSKRWAKVGEGRLRRKTKNSVVTVTMPEWNSEPLSYTVGRVIRMNLHRRTDFPRYSVVGSKYVMKRMNLNDDPATWQMHEVRGEFDGGLLVNYILYRSRTPPLYFSTQLIIVEAVVRSSEADDFEALESDSDEEDSAERDGESIADVFNEVRGLADSFTVLQGLTVVYDDLVAYNANALLYPLSTLRWLLNRHKVYPRCYESFKLYVKTVVMNYLPNSKFRKKFVGSEVLEDEDDLKGFEPHQQLTVLREKIFFQRNAKIFIGIDPFAEDVDAEIQRNQMIYRSTLFLAELFEDELQLLRWEEISSDFDRQSLLELLLFLTHARSRNFSTQWSTRDFLDFGDHADAGESHEHKDNALAQVMKYKPLSRIGNLKHSNLIYNSTFFVQLLSHADMNTIRLMTAASQMGRAPGSLSQTVTLSDDFRWKLHSLTILSNSITNVGKVSLLRGFVKSAIQAGDDDRKLLLLSYAGPLAVALLNYFASRPTPENMNLLNATVFIIGYVLRSKLTPASLRFRITDTQTCEGLVQLLSAWNTLELPVLTELLRIVKKISSDRGGSFRLCNAGVAAKLINILAATYDTPSDALLDVARDICKVIGDLVDVPSVTDLMSTRLPTLDMILLLFHQVAISGEYDKMVPLLVTLRRMVKTNPKLVPQVGRHTCHTVLRLVCVSSSQEFVYYAVRLLVAVAADIPTIRKLRANGLLDTVNDYVMQNWVEGCDCSSEYCQSDRPLCQRIGAAWVVFYGVEETEFAIG